MNRASGGKMGRGAMSATGDGLQAISTWNNRSRRNGCTPNYANPASPVNN